MNVPAPEPLLAAAGLPGRIQMLPEVENHEPPLPCRTE
jgi:hypothetical protein